MLRIVLFHFLLSGLILGVLKCFKCRISCLYFWILLTMPFVGELVIIVHFICKKMIKKNHVHEICNIDSTIETPLSLAIRKAELEGYEEIIPVEEALIISENQVKRKVLISALKVELEEYLDIIESALKDDDTETTHYAAAFITELKRKLHLLLQEAQRQYQSEKTSRTFVKEYLLILYRYIKAGMVDNQTMQRLVQQYFDAYDDCFKDNSSSFESLRIYIELAIMIKDYNRALKYGRVFKERYSSRLEPYQLLLEIYYNLKNYQEFEQIIEELQVKHQNEEQNMEQLLGIWTGRGLHV